MMLITPESLIAAGFEPAPQKSPDGVVFWRNLETRNWLPSLLDTHLNDPPSLIVTCYYDRDRVPLVIFRTRHQIYALPQVQSIEQLDQLYQLLRHP